MYLNFGSCLKIFESGDKWGDGMPVIMSNETDTSVLLRAFTKGVRIQFPFKIICELKNILKKKTYSWYENCPKNHL